MDLVKKPTTIKKKSPFCHSNRIIEVIFSICRNILEYYYSIKYSRGFLKTYNSVSVYLKFYNEWKLKNK